MSLQEELHYLFTRYLEDRLSAEERARLLVLLRTEENRTLLAGRIEELMSREVRGEEMNDQRGRPGETMTDQQKMREEKMDKQLLFQQVLEEAEIRSGAMEPAASRGRVREMGRRLSYAAAVVLVLVAAWWFAEKRNAEGQMATHLPGKRTTPSSVRHGGNQVLLTLADGSQVPLDTVKEGLLDEAKRTQPGADIFKTGQGEIIYKPTAGGADRPADGGAALVYNTITTPRGGQYHIVLPDNTQVWLNAASSLKFPVAFSGKERTVLLSGEGYFEVAKDAVRPFAVVVAGAGAGGTKNPGGVNGADEGGMRVNVLGTHFNVMAYANENSVRTTLLEGSVRLTNHGGNLLLKPGQQGSLSPKNNDFNLSVPDINEVLAWKNGEFRFDGTPVSTIMRQIERWYDLSVVYEGDMKEITLSGVISRREDVSQLLDILEATHKIHFRLENDRLTVMPYEKK